MSWDIFVQDLPADAQTLEDIPADFKPAAIVKRSEIIEKIKEIAPTANFSDPSWGLIEGNGWSIEVNLGSEEECTDFALHVRGAETAVGAVEAIITSLGLRAVDSQTGDFFRAGPEAIGSFRRWRTFRDNVVGMGNDKRGNSK